MSNNIEEQIKETLEAIARSATACEQSPSSFALALSGSSLRKRLGSLVLKSGRPPKLSELHAIGFQYDPLVEDRSECKSLRADNARLREALGKHGQHGHWCDHATWIPGPEGRAGGNLAGCTCGLAAVLKEPDAQQSES